MGFVVGMHVALLFVLARSFNLVPTTVFDKGVGVVIDETTPPEVPPPPPDPTFERHEVVLVPRETTIDTESDPEHTITEPQRPERSVEGTGGSAEVVPVLVNVRQDPRHPLTQPPYPPFDQRMGNEGSVDIEIYVLPNGRVGDARVIRSSGFDRMDQSALDEAKRRWRLQPATRDGEPFAQWHRLRVTFQLRNQ